LSESLALLSSLESVCTFIAYRGFESHPVRGEVVIPLSLNIVRRVLFVCGCTSPVSVRGVGLLDRLSHSSLSTAPRSGTRALQATSLITEDSTLLTPSGDLSGGGVPLALLGFAFGQKILGRACPLIRKRPYVAMTQNKISRSLTIGNDIKPTHPGYGSVCSARRL
jgi:hypothetical protein